MEQDDPIMLSALQHYSYCPRQCALIHEEQSFADNQHTARGNAVHALVDLAGYELRAGVRIERALPLVSERPMLMNDCRTAIESVGLDPQLGYLHTVRPGRAALALDLMEEFRSLLADRLALTLVNRKQLQAGDFEDRPGGACQMHDAARKDLILAYQERKQELVTHPLLDQKLTVGLLPQIQARLLARVIRGEAEDYLPYLEH